MTRVATPPEKPPKAVFFDVGWTLAYPRASLWDIFAGLGREAGSGMAAGDAERLVHTLMAANRDNAVAEFEAGALYTDSDQEFVALFSTMARAIFSLAGVPGDHDTLSARFMERFWNRDNWVAFPDAVEVIGRLRERGIRVGVLSNAGSELLGFLDGLGLLGLCDFTVVSAIEGTKKPDRRIYERAIERAGVRPEEAVHVGDMYLEDVLGPRRAGVRPLLIDRGPLSMFPNHPESANHAEPSFDIVRDLGEVLPALGLA
jgi:HAD superfamily hydrolase (TIGR01549 family)